MSLNSKSSKTAIEPSKVSTPDPFEFLPIPSPVVRKSLYMVVMGVTNSRKTTFSLSMPEPVAVFNFDGLLYDVVHRHYPDKKIISITDELVMIAKDSDEENQAQANVIWGRFKPTYYNALSVPLSEVRSISIDTTSHLWEIARWADLGKLMQIQAHHYGAVNQQFRSLMQSAKFGNKNVMFTHRVKDEWINNKATGNKTLAGFGDMADESEIFLQTSVIMDSPEIRVLKCKPNPEKEGHTYKGDDQCNFAYIAHDITRTPIKDWQ